MEPRKILVAVDGSPAAGAALEAALDLASETGATLRLVHARSPLAELLYEEGGLEGPTRAQVLAADEVLSEAAQAADRRSVPAEVELVADGGSELVADSIVGIAAGIDASMIVVGSRGLGPFAGAVLGSVSQDVVRFAPVPALVVHAPREAARAAEGRQAGAPAVIR